MPKLFVANATKQSFTFSYRLPEAPGTHEQTIRVGHQTQINEDLTAAQIDYIIQQFRRYGMIEAGERAKGFCGLCYSINKPVPSTPLHALLEHNVDVLVDLGRRLRRDAALSVNKSVADETPQELGIMRELELTVDEEGASHGQDKVKERIIVSETAEPHEAEKRATTKTRRAR